MCILLPRDSSPLNQVELWFNLITHRAILRGTSSNVKELIAEIGLYVKEYNKHPRPLVWTANANSILAKLERLCRRISEIQQAGEPLLLSQ